MVQQTQEVKNIQLRQGERARVVAKFLFVVMFIRFKFDSSIPCNFTV